MEEEVESSIRGVSRSILQAIIKAFVLRMMGSQWRDLRQ